METFDRIVSAEQNATLQKMLGEISGGKIKAVSFRLKDVLTVMPFSSGGDMFMLMEEDFRKVSKVNKAFFEVRTDAEDSLRKKSKNITLDNIYSIISKTAKIKDIQSLKDRECAMAESFSAERVCGKILYNHALKENKKIIISSDGLYPEEVVKNILKKCGYDKYDILIFSEDFGEIMKQSGVETGELLHIGGNVTDDVETPIMKGVRALLLSPEIPLMVKSGRLRGFVQSEKLLDIDSPAYLGLRCAFGLYAMYGFDIPQNKAIKSDFCNNAYMLGFMVFGTLNLTDYQPETEWQKNVISSLEKNPKIIQGMEDFRELFDKYFSGYDMDFSGCELPLIFLEKYSAQADRIILRSCVSDGIYKKWSQNITEPEILPVYARTVKKNALSKLADKLFPHGTKLRTITDTILAKSQR